jgi:hypothetical protein
MFVVGATGWIIQSEKGIKLISEFIGRFQKFIDTFRMVFRGLVYPINYLKMSNEYAYSSAHTPEHFYILKRYKKQQGERMFNEIEGLVNSRFGKDAGWQVMDLVINLAYEMSLKDKDIRDLLEIQVPVAIEVSEGIKDFQLNLGMPKYR